MDQVNTLWGWRGKPRLCLCDQGLLGSLEFHILDSSAVLPTLEHTLAAPTIWAAEIPQRLLLLRQRINPRGKARGHLYGIPKHGFSLNWISINVSPYAPSSEGSLAAAVTGVTGQITLSKPLDSVIPGAPPQLFALLIQPETSVCHTEVSLLKQRKCVP